MDQSVSTIRIILSLPKLNRVFLYLQRPYTRKIWSHRFFPSILLTHAPTDKLEMHLLDCISLTTKQPSKLWSRVRGECGRSTHENFPFFVTTLITRRTWWLYTLNSNSVYIKNKTGPSWESGNHPHMRDFFAGAQHLFTSTQSYKSSTKKNSSKSLYEF